MGIALGEMRWKSTRFELFTYFWQGVHQMTPPQSTTQSVSATRTRPTCDRLDTTRENPLGLVDIALNAATQVAQTVDASNANSALILIGQAAELVAGHLDRAAARAFQHSSSARLATLASESLRNGAGILSGENEPSGLPRSTARPSESPLEPVVPIEDLNRATSALSHASLDVARILPPDERALMSPAERAACLIGDAATYLREASACPPPRGFGKNVASPAREPWINEGPQRGSLGLW